MPAKTKSTRTNSSNQGSSASPMAFWATTKRVLEEMYIVHLILLLIATSLVAILVMISFQQKNVIDNLSFQLDFTKQLCNSQKMDAAAKKEQANSGSEKTPKPTLMASPQPARR